MTRFQIAPSARAEAIETMGEDFAISVLGLFDPARDIYAPVCVNSDGSIFLDGSRARHVWSDMLEAL